MQIPHLLILMEMDYSTFWSEGTIKEHCRYTCVEAALNSLSALSVDRLRTEIAIVPRHSSAETNARAAIRAHGEFHA